jgi:hypothetical protein
MELYNEELTDLLSLNDSDKDKRLRLLEDRSGVVVQGLEEMVVKSAAGKEGCNLVTQDTQHRKPFCSSIGWQVLGQLTPRRQQPPTRLLHARFTVMHTCACG